MKKDKIFLTICNNCKKRIAVKVSEDRFCHGVYTCNDCVPKTSSIRNGIDEAIETDLFDELNIK